MVLAEAESGVLLRSFLIAVVVVAPFGWWQWRRVRANRRTAAAAAAAVEAEQPPPPVGLASLESVVAEIAERARQMQRGEGCTLEVPHRLSIDGTEAEPALLDALLQDALRRDGLQLTAEIDAEDHRVLHCVKR
jgi:hypothetical protein